MVETSDDGAWFTPKTFGYGTGMPIRWQGWAMLLGNIAVILPGVLLLKDRPAATFAWVMLTAVLPMPLYAAKTRGGWRWRWGRRE